MWHAGRVVAAVLIAATGLGSVQAAPPALPEPFHLSQRTPHAIFETVGVSVDPRLPGLEWRIVAGRDRVEFSRLLAAEEASRPFDLVFPVDWANASTTDEGTTPAHRGLLLDRHTLLRPVAPGAEFRVRHDGVWSWVERPSDLAPRMQLSGLPSGSLSISDWNPPRGAVRQGNAPMVWTAPFTPFSGPVPHPLQWLRLTRDWSEPWGAGHPLYPVQPIHNSVWRLPPAAGKSPGVAPGADQLLLAVSPAVGREVTDLAYGKELHLEAPCAAGLEAASVAFGGLAILERRGKWVAPDSPQAALDWARRHARGDLSALFTARGAPLAWIGLGADGRVWMGCTNLSTGRNATFPAPRLADLTETLDLELLAVAGAGYPGPTLRWDGQWLGTRSQTPDTPIRSALCLRLPTEGAAQGFVNLLRDPQIVIEPHNVQDPGAHLAGLRDGRMRLDRGDGAIWWTRAEDPEEPVALEFDLRRPETVYWIEVHQASAAGFSKQFNLESYRWEWRASRSDPWQRSAEAASAAHAVFRHVIPPTTARYWRLVIPPSRGEAADRILRLAEIQFWTFR